MKDIIYIINYYHIKNITLIGHRDWINWGLQKLSLFDCIITPNLSYTQLRLYHPFNNHIASYPRDLGLL